MRWFHILASAGLLLFIASCQTISLPGLYGQEGPPAHLYELEKRGLSFIQLSVADIPKELLASFLPSLDSLSALAYIDQVLIFHPESLFTSGEGDAAAILLRHFLPTLPENIEHIDFINDLFAAGGGAELDEIAPGLALLFATERTPPLPLLTAILSPESGEGSESAVLSGGLTGQPVPFRAAIPSSGLPSARENPLTVLGDAEAIALASFRGGNSTFWLARLPTVKTGLFSLARDENDKLFLSALLFSVEENGQARALAVALRLLLRRRLEEDFPGHSAREYRQMIQVKVTGSRIHVDAFPVSAAFVLGLFSTDEELK